LILDSLQTNKSADQSFVCRFVYCSHFLAKTGLQFAHKKAPGKLASRSRVKPGTTRSRASMRSALAQRLRLPYPFIMEVRLSEGEYFGKKHLEMRVGRLILSESVYLTDTKIPRHSHENACKALREEAAPLSQVALDCGFADQAHFCRVFKQFVGMTPTEFKSRANLR
jgi:hypothetical protein